MDTRQKILVTTLLLFNEKGEAKTSTNEIAVATGISPGNLHYHFPRKSLLVDALLAEFRVDARRVLQPAGEKGTLDDFWVFVHLLLECTTAYRFLFRDIQSLVATYPHVGTALRQFSRALVAVFEQHIHAMQERGVLRREARGLAAICRSLAVTAIYSEHFDSLCGCPAPTDVAAANTGVSILSLLRPYVAEYSRAALDQLIEGYRV